MQHLKYHVEIISFSSFREEFNMILVNENRYTVEPVLRDHIWRQEKVAL